MDRKGLTGLFGRIASSFSKADDLVSKSKPSSTVFDIFTGVNYQNLSAYRPIGPKSQNELNRIANCVVFFIYCPVHKKVALTKTKDHGISFLPYAHLLKDKSWRDSALDASYSILTANNAQEIFKLKKNPPYELAEIVEIHRFQVSSGTLFNRRILVYCRIGQKPEALKRSSNCSQNKVSSRSSEIGRKPSAATKKESNPDGQGSKKKKKKNRIRTASNQSVDSTKSRPLKLQSKMSIREKGTPFVFKCCEQRGGLYWVPINEIRSGKATDYKFWGPEIVLYARHMDDFFKIKPLLESIQVGENHRRGAALTKLQTFQKICEDGMINSVGITQNDIDRIYWDFLNHCFPAFYMTIWSFKAYMISYGFGDNESKAAQLFGAFNVNRNGYVSFREFLMGLTCMEPGSVHSDYRLSFVYRYYDTRNVGMLSDRDFFRMMRDNYQNESPDSVEKRAKAIIEKFKKEIKARNGMSWNTFRFIVNSTPIRGTSMLCRSRKNIFAHITQLVGQRQMELHRATEEKSKVGQIIQKRHKVQCLNCRKKNYKVLRFSVQLGITGCPLRKPVNLVGFGKVDVHSRKVEPVLDPSSPVNQFMFAIHKFNCDKGDLNNPKGLWQDNPQNFYKMFKKLCENVRELLKAENNKCPATWGPTMVVGDIHGNLEDLLSLERAIWSKLFLTPSRTVFLGDYVDRGKWSIECAVYVLCLKVCMPKKITLLRGNHEVRNIQEKYSFLAECVNKYTEEIGPKVWDLLNVTLDRFPIACTIDDSFYGAHGGIPYDVGRIVDIQSLPLDIKSPEHDFAMVWEIMWSDPISQSQFVEICKYFNVDPETGFVKNTKRGAAFFYAEQGAVKFLKDNGLTHIVRGHEVPGPGFSFHFLDDRCITVFSCSHYCGNLNDAAVVFLDRFENKIRIVRIDTSMNSPATDPG